MITVLFTTKIKVRLRLELSTEIKMIYNLANLADPDTVVRIGKNRPHTIFKVHDNHRYAPIVKVERNTEAQKKKHIYRRFQKVSCFVSLLIYRTSSNY